MAHPYHKEIAGHMAKRVSRITQGYGHEKTSHRADKFARGGRTKGKTVINIHTAPAGGANAMPVPVPVPAGGPPVLPPHPPMGGPPPGLPPGLPSGGPPGLPPGLMPHARGGRAFKKGGRISSEQVHTPTLKHAAGGGLGRLEKLRMEKKRYP